jgi:hypothetical protein
LTDASAGAAEPALKWYRRDAYDERGYKAHLANLTAELPASLVLLGEGGGSINLHDAWLIDARKAEDALILDIAAYDYARSGWNDARVDLHVRIIYQGGAIHGPSIDDLWLWRRSGIEILAGEFDRLGDDRYVHRFLMSDKSAMAVSFRSADLVAVRFVGTDASVVGDDG